MNSATIIANNINFNYGKLRVINNLSLEIAGGISFGLLGPNGSGKTTFIRLMVGLLKPTTGEIMYFGKKWSRATAKLIGYMPQLPALYSELSVEQNLDFFASIYGLRNKKQREQRVNEVINIVDLWQKRKTQVMKLSGGMKQRVSLGCAIVHQPRILFLDEPTVGLDPQLRVSFWNYFDSLVSNGTTLVISSHTMDDAAHCQKLVFLREGNVIAHDTPLELKRATGSPDSTLEEAFIYFINQDEIKKNVQ